MPLHDSNQILAVKLAAYNKNIDEVRNWYKSEHMNFKVIDGERSKWWVWNTTLEFSRESVRQIQTYLQRISDGKTVCNRADINKMFDDKNLIINIVLKGLLKKLIVKACRRL